MILILNLYTRKTQWICLSSFLSKALVETLQTFRHKQETFIGGLSLLNIGNEKISWKTFK